MLHKFTCTGTMYGFKNAYKSNLENVGDRQEKILYVNNIYGPTNFNSSYGNTIDINKKIQTKSNLGDYGYFYAIDSKLERIGVIKETELILNNLYKPTNLQYGTLKRGFGCSFGVQTHIR